MPYSLPEFFDTAYTVNIKAPENSILLNLDTLPEDGFFIAYTVKDNIKDFFYSQDFGWVHFSTTNGSVHTNLAFHARRDQFLEQLSATFHISCVLDKAEIPLEAQVPLILEIQQAIVSIAHDPSYAAPKIMPVLVEITKWSSRDIWDSISLPSDDEEDIADDTTADMPSLAMDENELKATPAARSAIQLLEKVKVDAVNDQERVCTICFEDFLEGAELISMPCKHVFHGECITKWLQKSNICPLCRFQMPVDPSE